MSENLLPCPFCGGPAGEVGLEFVTCLSAEVGTEQTCPGKQIRVDVEDAERWNTRAGSGDPAPQVPEPPAQQRLETLSNELVGEAFCADWHDDPERGAREISRIKALFIDRLLHFACDEIKLHLARQPVAPPVHSAAMTGELVTYQWRNASFGWQNLLTPIDVFRKNSADKIASGEIEIRALYAAPTTSPAPDAVREALKRLIKAVNYRDGVMVADHVPMDMIQHAADKLERAISAGRAALSRPAHGGWEALREALAGVTVDLIATAAKDEDPLEWTTVRNAYAALGLEIHDPLPRNDRGSPLLGRQPHFMPDDTVVVRNTDADEAGDYRLARHGDVVNDPKWEITNIAPSDLD